MSTYSASCRAHRKAWASAIKEIRLLGLRCIPSPGAWDYPTDRAEHAILCPGQSLAKGHGHFSECPEDAIGTAIQLTRDLAFRAWWKAKAPALTITGARAAYAKVHPLD